MNYSSFSSGKVWRVGTWSEREENTWQNSTAAELLKLLDRMFLLTSALPGLL